MADRKKASILQRAGRALMMRRHRSSVPTSIAPLEKVRSVAVYMDLTEPGCEPFKIRMKDFFDRHGISMRVLSELDRDIRCNEDMFLSLVPVETVSERYAAKSSGAFFKVGRHQLKGNIYDLVVSEPESGKISDQPSGFEQISVFLERIK